MSIVLCKTHLIGFKEEAIKIKREQNRNPFAYFYPYLDKVNDLSAFKRMSSLENGRVKLPVAFIKRIWDAKLPEVQTEVQEKPTSILAVVIGDGLDMNIGDIYYSEPESFEELKADGLVDNYDLENPNYYLITKTFKVKKVEYFEGNLIRTETLNNKKLNIDELVADGSLSVLKFENEKEVPATDEIPLEVAEPIEEVVTVEATDEVLTNEAPIVPVDEEKPADVQETAEVSEVTEEVIEPTEITEEVVVETAKEDIALETVEEETEEVSEIKEDVKL